MLLLLMLLQVAPTAPSPVPTPPPRSARLTGFLTNSIGLDTAQLSALERGEPIAKVLPSKGRDIALFGIVTLRRSRTAYTRAARRVPSALQMTGRTLGLFSTPAVEADMAAFSVSSKEAETLEDCEPGDCGLKLSAAEMDHIRAQTNWSAPDVEAQISAYARRRIAQYVNDYRTHGDSVLVGYDDRGDLTVHSGESFEAELSQSPYIFGNVPSLFTYLTRYPHDSLPNATEVIYWSLDSVTKLKPILSVQHYLVYTPAELPTATIVATKLIYADHYFETALDLNAAIDRGSGSYLLILRRLRFDNIPGGFIIRGRVVSGLKNMLLEQLKWEHSQ